VAITVKEIHEKVFTRQVRGYNSEEVDDFLDELADQMATLIRENRDMMTQLQNVSEAAPAKEVPVANPAPVVVQSAPVPAAPVAPVIPAVEMPQPDAMEDTGYFKNLETTLRETLLNAQRIADETVAEARKKANQMLANAEEKASAITAAAKVEAEAIHTEAEEVRKACEEYRGRFLRLVEDQMHVLKADEDLFK
jgi:cell division initiation protein